MQGQKNKNRSDTLDPIKLHGAPPHNLQLFIKKFGSPPHVTPQDLPCVAVFHAVRTSRSTRSERTEAATWSAMGDDMAIRHAFSLPNFFGPFQRKLNLI